MSTLHFSTPFTADRIDEVNAIIRGVSVITSGLIARGHDLEVDRVTLQQMHTCATAKGQVPVKVDHRSGAAAVCGFLTNFRHTENKLIADWHLLESHPQKDQILEIARRMPRGVGLSASFVSPDDGERGKARCADLISVDYVTLPAANPDGMFAAKVHERPLSGVDRVDSVLIAARRGAETGALGGLAARAILRRRGLKAGTAAATGAILGAAANGVLQYKRDKPNDLAARVSTILFQERAALRRITDAVGSNVSVQVPVANQATAVVRYAKKPIVKRIGTRLIKVGAGAGLGYIVGRKVGAKAGAITGAVAGALFESPHVRGTIRLSCLHAKKTIL